MARIGYDDAAAAAFQATRHLPPEGLAAWRETVERYLAPRPGMRLLDLGAGTGMWAAAFADWYGIEVVAVEPSGAMRARSSFPGVVAGHAGAIPLQAASMDAAWLSTVVHHLPDLPLAASELSRVLRPGAPLLIRSAFPGRHQRITLFRFFPEALGCSTPTPACLGLRRVRWRRLRLRRPRAGAPGGRRLPPGMADGLRRDAHTPLKLLTDQEYATGLARLRAAADAATGPVLDALDLLVLCKGGPAADRSGSTRR